MLFNYLSVDQFKSLLV